MEYKLLGRTGLRVSAVGMGCEGFGGKTYGECREMADCALERGINFFDMYTSDPDIRSNLGRALGRYPRESFVVQGHLCTIWEDGQYCRTREIGQVKAGFEDLLARMGLSYVDVGMLHYVDAPADFEAAFNGPVMEYARALLETGVIRSLGLSTHNPEVALRALDTGLIDVMLFSINPAYDMLPASEDIEPLFEADTFRRVYEGVEPTRALLYQRCQSQGVALTVMKAFAGGLLLDAKQSPFGRALTPAQCIHYCLTRPGVASVMCGAANVEEIRAAAAYCGAPEAERDYGPVLAGAPRTAFQGRCMYCGHCAPCTSRIDIAAVNKYLDLAQAQGGLPETLREHYALLSHHAGECVACGRCEANCPFGVPVMERMRRAQALFGR